MADNDQAQAQARARAKERLQARRAAAGPTGPFLKEYPPNGVQPQVSAQKALVLFYRNGGHSVVTVTGTRHVDKRALARPHTVCEIALGTYQTPLEMELPAAGGTSFFKAEVDIHWTVDDPHLAAVQVVTDIAKRLTAPILERLHEVTSAYRVHEAEQANRAITRECAGGRWSGLGAELGLNVRLYVRLRVDDRAIEHMNGIRDAHASAEVTRVHQARFRAMLQGGELEQLSYMLAAEPTEAKDFLEKIRQEGRQDEKERVDRLFDMVESGQIQSNDVETQALSLLNRGRLGGVTGPIGSLPARRDGRDGRPGRPAPELEPSGAEPFTPDWVSDEPPTRVRRQDAYPADPYPDDDSAPEPPRRRRPRDNGWDWADGNNDDGEATDQ
ncbi:hypothetical protein [Streptomyces sp. NBC_00576]|uniref:hypothetical protein n=1 Tax=Streptomyces sp. NBC_00576 TaxID=2903665 RepID=UPI002E820BB4|nr:hypothetical protein [Streptomyces sp. NBC_00576]WUB72570.1 hypothetical protein OG734_22010 [Streptomyces sp. NBC_00576]